MDLRTLKNIYFLGIGGIGMSALARYFKARGIHVSGYDKTTTPLTTELEAEGISVHYIEDIGKIPENIDLVVYTPAIPKDNEEYLHFISEKFLMVKRAELLGEITAGQFTIAVAGTHGKTSITAMIAHVLKTAGIPFNAFIGGIPVNTGTNLEFNPEASIILTEADEFDRSFLHIKPDIAIVSSVDADHLDIYGDWETLRQAFTQFAAGIKEKGLLIFNEKLQGFQWTVDRKTSYGLSGGENFAEDVRVVDGKFVFNAVTNRQISQEISLQVPGRHNVENALAAACVAMELGVETPILAMALASFKGVKRRFEIHVNSPEIKFVDDYAHHPEEIKACIQTVRALWPGEWACGIFQPHLFTRTRDFMDGFAEVLREFDEVILLPIYPARELPLEGVTSEALCSKIGNKKCRVLQPTEIESFARTFTKGVLITIGAGNIDTVVEPITRVLGETLAKGEHHA